MARIKSKRGFYKSPFMSKEFNKAMENVKKVKKAFKEAKEDNMLKLSYFKKLEEQKKRLVGGRKGFYYSQLYNMSDKDLELYNNIMENFLNSPQSTREKREDIHRKAKETFKSNFSWTEEEANIYYDFLATDLYHELLEAGYITSEQLMEISLMPLESQDIFYAFTEFKALPEDKKIITDIVEFVRKVGQKHANVRKRDST